MNCRNGFGAMAWGLSLSFLLPAAAGLAASPGMDHESAARILADWRSSLSTDPRFTEIEKNEAVVAELQEALLAPWARAWRARDAASFAGLLEAEAAVPDLAGAKRESFRDRDGILESRASLRAVRPASSEIARYLGGFSSVEDVSLEAVRIERSDSGAVLSLRYDLRGGAGGERRNDRAELRVRCRKTAAGWRIAEVSAPALETLTARAPSFVDGTKEAGLDSAPVWPRLEAIRRGGYGTAVGDYDGDGSPDIYLGAWGAGTLYRNDGGGRFLEATEGAGIGKDKMVKAAAFSDLDGDGKQDLALVRFVEDPSKDFVLYRGKGGGRFEPGLDPLTRAKAYDRSMPMAIADFDLDGRLDLWLGFPGVKDFSTMSPGRPTVTPQGLFRNQGDGRFSDDTDRWGRLGAVCRLYPHNALASDLDADGRPDLLVVDDRANLSPIYRNLGEGSFMQSSDRMGVANWGWGMTVSAADYDGDGLQDLFYSNIDFTAAQRILNSRPQAGSEEERFVLGMLRNVAAGNRLFRNLGGWKFEEVTDRAGLRWAGEGAGGAEWVDYNNDGLMDLYVVNGLWSGPEESRDVSSLFIRRYLQRMADDPASAREVDPEEPTLMALLQGFRGTLGADVAAPAAAHPTLSLGGGQRNRLFRNNGDGTFTEIGYLAGVDRVEDGYMAAVADVDRDGRQDLVLRNGDPAVPGMRMPTLVLLRNVHPAGNRSLTVLLEGEGANRDAIGARLTAWIGGRQLVREIRATAGTTQNERAAHFGLGGAQRVDRLEVRWPSGRSETLTGLKPGRFLLREGQGKVIEARLPKQP